MNQSELIDFLNFKADQYENPVFIESDPIQIPHQFQTKEDIEIIGLLISLIAWGNRKMIIKNGRKLCDIMEREPHQFVMNYTKQDLNFVHRTFNAQDLDFMLRALQRVYKNQGLEACFKVHPEIPGMKGRIVNFRTSLLHIEHEIRSEKHLSNPIKNSAGKRINMFLRWMVRNSSKGVDFGIWKSIHPSELMLPLDVHTSKNARKLGLLTRKQDDWKALDEIMHHLRKFDNNDPVKYDFALFGLGVFETF